MNCKMQVRLILLSFTSNMKTLQVIECDGVPHVCLIALKTIYKDREILYDYGDRSKVRCVVTVESLWNDACYVQESLAAHPWLKE